MLSYGIMVGGVGWLQKYLDFILLDIKNNNEKTRNIKEVYLRHL